MVRVEPAPRVKIRKSKAKLPWLLLLVFSLLLLFWQIKRQSPNKPELEPVVLPAAVTPPPTLAKAGYSNLNFKFTLLYSAEWGSPQEKKISPPQEHLYQIVFNPGGSSYLVDIYSQPTPISLASFARDYFKDVDEAVSWLKEVQINGQPAIKFFLPKNGLRPQGVGVIAFRKKGYILTISTPVLAGKREEILADHTLAELAESFHWTD